MVDIEVFAKKNFTTVTRLGNIPFNVLMYLFLGVKGQSTHGEEFANKYSTKEKSSLTNTRRRIFNLNFKFFQ